MSSIDGVASPDMEAPVPFEGEAAGRSDSGRRLNTTFVANRLS
jgi:hypothetical protein